MARPIPLEVPARDPRIALQARLQDAPAEHAEALLAAYDVLQGLHDAGVLDILRGGLQSRDKVVDIAVDAAGSADSVRSIRNLLLLINMLGAIDPATLKTFTQAGPPIVQAMVCQREQPGLWTLLKDFLWNADFRRGLSAVNTMLKVFGRSLSDGPRSDGSH